jgi:hypothetical protein
VLDLRPYNSTGLGARNISAELFGMTFRVTTKEITERFFSGLITLPHVAETAKFDRYPEPILRVLF